MAEINYTVQTRLVVECVEQDGVKRVLPVPLFMNLFSNCTANIQKEQIRTVSDEGSDETNHKCMI